MIDFKLLINKAKEQGFEDIEIIEKKSSALEINLFNSKVDKNVLSQNNSILVKAIYQEKLATLNIENFNYDLDDLLNKLKNNAVSIEAEEKNEIFAGSESYPEVCKNDFDFKSIPTSEKINLLLQLENKCKELDNRIVKISDCAYEEAESSLRIVNSKGLDITKGNKYCIAVVGVVAVENNDTQNEYQMEAKLTFNELNIDEIAKKAVEKTVAKFNAKPVPTGKYKIIMDNSAMSSLLSVFHSMFTGLAAMRKISPFIGKLDQKIMSDKITIIDNPLLEEAINKQPFDDEGVACFKKNVVEKGVFKTFLHNLKTAKLFNTTSTGNGFSGPRGSSTSGCNFYIEKGNKSKEELISSLEKGLLITGLDGLHAGVNPISGDFSVKADGFLIENGKIARAVTLIVISGNFIEMMNNVIEVGSDLEISPRAVFAPSILFDDLSVSGE